MKNEDKTFTLSASDCAYICTLIKRELDAVSKSYTNAADETSQKSYEICKNRLQHIYDIICE